MGHTARSNFFRMIQSLWVRVSVCNPRCTLTEATMPPGCRLYRPHADASYGVAFNLLTECVVA